MPNFRFADDRVSICRTADDSSAKTLAASIEKLQMVSKLVPTAFLVE